MLLKDGKPVGADRQEGVPGLAQPPSRAERGDPEPAAVPSCRYALAIGVGFRRACTPETLAALVREALRRLTDARPAWAGTSAVLVSIAEKDRPALHAAGAALGLPVAVLSKQALAGTEDRITVVSSVAKACLGVPSVAEAAALAAAGAGSRLLVARVSVPEATCAIAAAAGAQTA